MSTWMMERVTKGDRKDAYKRRNEEEEEEEKEVVKTNKSRGDSTRNSKVVKRKDESGQDG